MIEWYWYLIFYSCVFMLSALRDKLKQHWNKSIFKKWTKGTKWEDFFEPSSWDNKYEQYSDGTIKVVNGKRVRKKILGIVRLPVVFTNAWHMAKGGEILGISLITCFAIAQGTEIELLQYWYYNLVGLVLWWSIGFEILHGELFETKGEIK